MNKLFKKFIAVACSLACFCGLLTAKADAVSYSVYSNKWGSTSEANTVEAEESVALSVRLTNLNTVSGFNLTVTYDNNAFKFNKSNSYTGVSNDKDGVVSYNDTGKGRLNILWDTTSKNTPVNYDLVTVCFAVAADADAGEYDFTVNIKELYDGSGNFVTAEQQIPTAKINIINSSLTDEQLAAFSALNEIRYPDSYEDIVKADDTYRLLTRNQKLSFANGMPELFSVYQNAWNVYYKLAENAAVEEIEIEKNTFLSSYSDVLSKTVEAVTLADKERVESASMALNNLSSAASAKIDSSVKTLIKDLLKKIAELEEAEDEKQAAKEEGEMFISTFDLLWGLDADTVKNQYSDLLETIDMAMIDYEHLSDSAKLLVANQYAVLVQLSAQIDELAAADKKLSDARDEISDYQKKWRSILTLTPRTVKLEDKTAIELALADFDNLSDYAKELAAARQTSLKALLEVLKDIEKVETVETIKTVIEQVPGETQTLTVTETKTETVTQLKTKLIDNGIGITIIILFVLLGVSLLSNTATGIVWHKIKNGGKEDYAVEEHE